MPWEPVSVSRWPCSRLSSRPAVDRVAPHVPAALRLRVASDGILDHLVALNTDADPAPSSDTHPEARDQLEARP